MGNTDFRCPRCRLWLKAPVGQSVKCPTCGEDGRAPSLIEDGAKVTAMVCVSRIEGILLPGEAQAAYEEFREIIKHGMEAVLILWRRGLGEGPCQN